MDSSVITWIFVGVGVVIVAVIILAYMSTRGPADERALNKGWRDLARATRINFTPPKGTLDTARLHGEHRGREVAAAVRVRTAYATEGQQTHFYTRLEAYLVNPKRSYLRLSTKGAYRKTDQYLGQPLRPLGDAQIDGRYDIKCIPHDLAERMIMHSKSLHDDLLALRKDHYVEIELDGNSVSLVEAGLETRPATLIAMFNLLCDLGEAFERQQT
jgi:hypothetical protein